MTNKQFLEIEQRLLPDMPTFRIKGPSMILPPVEHLLRAVHFERSSRKDAFYVWRFVMPLCVPHRYINYNFGDRVRDSMNRGGWSGSSPGLIDELSACLQAEAVPFLSRVVSLLDFVELAKTHSLRNRRVSQAVAFCLARAGCYEEATEVIDQFLQTEDADAQWVADLCHMGQALRVNLVSDPLAAQAQLAAWEEETVRNLGLEEFRVRP